MKIEWNLEKTLGRIITIIGLLMLIYSFFLANTFVIGYLIIDEAFLIRLIFLVFMILIGGYMTNKGITLTGNTKTFGLVLFFLGIGMLIFSFLMANVFVIGMYSFTLSHLIRLIFYSCMIGIGIGLIKKGHTCFKNIEITSA